MFGFDFTIVLFGALMIMVIIGIPVVISLGLCSFFGLYFIMDNFNTPLSLLQNTAYGAIRDYVFAVIPLFVLMGEFISKSGAAKDLYNLIHKSLRRIPGRLTLATVFGNAFFGAITGVSIASAAAFTRIAYPQMCNLNYNKTVSLGCIAGSASLGMLIPPSVLLIVWGYISEQSIGKLFIAGIIPGILLALFYATFVFIYSKIKPKYFGENLARDTNFENISKQEKIGALAVIFLIIIVLGGIWFGFFTPTEASGIGALFAFFLAIYKKVTFREILDAILETGKVSAPILLILICAQMYSRLLAIGGITVAMQEMFSIFADNKFLIFLFMIFVWIILGMFIDSISIILLTLPIFGPIADQFLGTDPIAFALIGIVVIEAGLLTPPLGLCVYTVKGSVSDPDATLGKIFKGAIPYWLLLILLAILIIIFPEIATWLPKKMS